LPHASPRLALAALVVAASVATAAPAAASRPPAVPADAASVSRGVCTTSATDPQARAVSFTVRMRTVAAATGYGFVAHLEERAPGARWARLKGSAAPPGFETLVPARAGAGRMVRKFTVRGLRPGSRYRLAVDAQWSFGGGVRTVAHTSRSCTVRDVRPNVLVTGEFGWQPSTVGGEVAYRIGVAATNPSALRDTDVSLVVRQGDTVLASGTYRPSAAREPVLLSGKRCVEGTPVVVQLDPQGLLDDRDPADDTLTAQCVAVP
jgi:hypothetical protein